MPRDWGVCVRNRETQSGRGDGILRVRAEPRTGSPGPLNSQPQPPPSWECGPGSLGQPDLALPLLGPGQMGSH